MINFIHVTRRDGGYVAWFGAHETVDTRPTPLAAALSMAAAVGGGLIDATHIDEGYRLLFRLATHRTPRF